MDEIVAAICAILAWIMGYELGYRHRMKDDE